MDKTPPHLPASTAVVASFTCRPRGRPATWVPWPCPAAHLPAADVRLAAVLWQQAIHDVRGKLGVVTNLTTLLQRPSTDERRAALVAMLDRNVSSLSQLLDGVADLARLDATPQAPVLHRVDVTAVLQGICQSVQALAESRGVRVEFMGPTQLLADTDVLMVERMAQNLMLNAVRYTRSSAVVLSCGSFDGMASGRWFFEVRDLAASTADAPPKVVVMPLAGMPLPAGEGIGLSIVARLSSLLGGEVQTTSTASGRCTRISLPRRPDLTLGAVMRSSVRGSSSPRFEQGLRRRG